MFTGLEVSHEPGQWSVWAGVVLMAIGLTFVFYVVHARIWVVPVEASNGSRALWIGGSANRNRDAFEEIFMKLARPISAITLPFLLSIGLFAMQRGGYSRYYSGATVPFSQPSASGWKCRLARTGSGTGLYPFVKIVARHQMIRITTITVVICMMRSAFSLDS